MKETKRRLLDSAMQVIARDGWPGLSVRSVANDAQVSPSHVQYYFHSRANLIAATYQHVGDKLVDHIAPFLKAEPTPATLLRILESWIPDTPERETWARTWVAFSAASLHEEVLSKAARETDEALRMWLKGRLHELTSCGAESQSLDADLVARQLLGLIDGLTLQALLLPVDERRDFVRPALIAMLTEIGLAPVANMG